MTIILIIIFIFILLGIYTNGYWNWIIRLIIFSLVFSMCVRCMRSESGGILHNVRWGGGGIRRILIISIWNHLSLFFFVHKKRFQELKPSGGKNMRWRWWWFSFWLTKPGSLVREWMNDWMERERNKCVMSGDELKLDQAEMGAGGGWGSGL